jgi:hypothetical protein
MPHPSINTPASITQWLMQVAVTAKHSSAKPLFCKWLFTARVAVHVHKVLTPSIGDTRWPATLRTAVFQLLATVLWLAERS